jgi:hypothetical protein
MFLTLTDRILQRLVKQNKLNLIGKGAGVKYIIK